MKRWWRHRSASPVTSVHQPRLRPDLVVPGSRASGLHTIDELVAELSSAGGLDEGSGDALDALIETWRLQHLEILRVYHVDRTAVRSRQLAELHARLAQAELEAQLAQRKAEEISARIEDGVAAMDDSRALSGLHVSAQRDEEAA